MFAFVGICCVFISVKNMCETQFCFKWRNCNFFDYRKSFRYMLGLVASKCFLWQLQHISTAFCVSSRQYLGRNFVNILERKNQNQIIYWWYRNLELKEGTRSFNPWRQRLFVVTSKKWCQSKGEESVHETVNACISGQRPRVRKRMNIHPANLWPQTNLCTQVLKAILVSDCYQMFDY